MRRDFLKNLGIEDKDVIDKILDENSADIGRAKGELDTYKDEVATLKKDILTKDNEIADLKGKVGDVEKLQTKISDLETNNTQLKNDLETKVSELQKTHNTENKVRDAKAKNVKAVMALLDPEKDIDEQLEALKSGEDTSFLFGDVQEPSLSGTHLNTPPSGGGNPPTSTTFAEAIAKAINKN